MAIHSFKTFAKVFSAFTICSGIPLAFAQSNYVLKESINAQEFFDHFNYWTGSDPTHGFVQYVNQSYAQTRGLVLSSSDSVRIGVDANNVYNADGGGRASVRLEGKNQYTQGLFILDAQHMPIGCGTWPAFWTYGPDWPSSGEIDIIEGVNTATKNLVSLHTSSGCTIAGSGQSGTLLTNNCDAGANSNSGCGVQAVASNSYGTGFNSVGGGVYAMEWTTSAIKVWFFPRGQIPSNIGSGYPDPRTFGTPLANFQGSCNIESHFKNHHIVLDTTFCGDYAGNVYGASGCPMYDSLNGYQSCKKYVAENPSSFKEAYWQIKSLQIYQLASGSSPNPAQPAAPVSSVIPVASTASLPSLNLAQGGNTEQANDHSSPFSPPIPTLKSKFGVPFALGNFTLFQNTTASVTLAPSGQGSVLPTIAPGAGPIGDTVIFGTGTTTTTMVYVTETVTACPSISQTCRAPLIPRQEL